MKKNIWGERTIKEARGIGCYQSKWKAYFNATSSLEVAIPNIGKPVLTNKNLYYLRFPNMSYKERRKLGDELYEKYRKFVVGIGSLGMTFLEIQRLATQSFDLSDLNNGGSFKVPVSSILSVEIKKRGSVVTQCSNALILRCLLSGEEKGLEFLGTFVPIGRGKSPRKLWKEWKEEKRKEIGTWKEAIEQAKLRQK